MTLREDDPMLKNVLGIADAMDRLVGRCPSSRAALPPFRAEPASRLGAVARLPLSQERGK